MKKRKIIALILLLCTVMLMFSSCFLWEGGKVSCLREFDSHYELISFVKEYNSQNDGSVYTFVSFDFDDDEFVRPYRYGLKTIWTVKKTLISKETKYTKLYDKDHSKGFDFVGEFVFHMSESDIQIKCTYITKDSGNIYSRDEISINYIKMYSFDELINDSEKMLELYSDYDNFIRDFADLRSKKLENGEYEKHFKYMYVNNIVIGEDYGINVYIFSNSELSEKQLNEIGKILLDNIVIINTEG